MRIKTLHDVNLRQAALRRGYFLNKRKTMKHCPGIGNGYMIIESQSGDIVAGDHYDLTPEQVRDFLNNHEL